MICEGCIKQDTCKYKRDVGEFEHDIAEIWLQEPLEVTISCKYKQTYPLLPCCDTTTDNPDPDAVGWHSTTGTLVTGSPYDPTDYH